MIHLRTGLLFLMVLTFLACRKTSFIESPDALLTLSQDTIRFDTVFTTTGSITQSCKILKQKDKKLRLSEVRLMGGSNSPFKLNVDGLPGTAFANLELEANDSMYVFISVSINPGAANLPFLVQDSILIAYNGNRTFLQLEAFGQNAHFMRGHRVTTDSTWNNDLPYVILDSISVDEGVTLTIQPGCRIYHHADAPFLVNGSLHTMGESNNRITFSGDRLDEGYRDLPGSWPGVFFRPASTGNVLQYTNILNAYQGIIAEGSPSTGTKVVMEQCQLQNISDAGILAAASSITATNCLISNCGVNVYLLAGGNYQFRFCTIATYGSLFIDHKQPVLNISNRDISGSSYPLSAVFDNCIIYGENGTVDNELAIDNIVPLGQVSFNNALLNNKVLPSNATFNGTIINRQSPGFANIDITKRRFNFRLGPGSPAINAGTIQPGIVVDLDGNPRNAGTPDLGCYEKQ